MNPTGLSIIIGWITSVSCNSPQRVSLEQGSEVVFTRMDLRAPLQSRNLHTWSSSVNTVYFSSVLSRRSSWFHFADYCDRSTEITTIYLSRIWRTWEYARSIPYYCHPVA